MKQYFNSLDVSNSGFIEIDQIEEVLISLGLCQSTGEVYDQIDLLNKDVEGKLDFEGFLHLLKQTSALGCHSNK